MSEYRFRILVQAFLTRKPFRPFVVQLNTGTQFTVTHPENLDVRDGIAKFVVPGEPPRTFAFDHESVCMIFDAENPIANQ